MQLRKLCKEDLAIRVEWMNNPRVYETMSFPIPITLEKTMEWYTSNVDNPCRADVSFLDDDNHIVAFGGLTNIDHQVKKAELYIYVDPTKQKKGIGAEATRLLCDYGFKELNLHKIYLLTNSSNIGAQKAYEKVGFKLEGIHREEKTIHGAYEDRLYYGLLPSDVKGDVKIGKKGFLILENHIVNGMPLSVVRDDLFPDIGGGNKARKALFYEEYMKRNGFNALVTTGGVQSNHNRAMALMAARNGWKCHLVYHGTKERFEREHGNALLVRLSGADVEFVDAEGISGAMDNAMERFRAEGLKPYYVTGGGHDLPGGCAFVEAVKELKQQCDKINYKPGVIVLASGTGSTQAGIAVGLRLVGWSDVKLIGVSVARQYERGKSVIVDFANKLAAHYGMNEDFEHSIIFTTDYLCGGYEQYSSDMQSFLLDVMRNTGLIFDTTYSGKAFWGMMDMVRKGVIRGKVMFWHTGGLMNVQK